MPAILPIPWFDGPIAEAFSDACETNAPQFVPAQIYTDDRGWSIMNQMQGILEVNGQVNYSVMYPGVIKAWHRHQKQTDFWLCTMGHLKVGVHRDDGTNWQLVIGEKRAGVVVIPPTLWHGACTVGNVPAGLLYYVTHAYDPDQPDEERRAYDSVPRFSWVIEHK